MTRLRKLGTAIGAAAATAYGGAIILSPPFSSNDHGSQLASFEQKIHDPAAVLPSREVQKSSLIGTSSVKPLDILVIGGGATGSGVALDAATRGLRVGLVEREDFSSGTSSRSTKLIHGGIRTLHLNNLDLDIPHPYYYFFTKPHHYYYNLPNYNYIDKIISL